MFKKCNDCYKNKPISEFYISYKINKKKIYKSECKSCGKIRSTKWGRKNKSSRYNSSIKHLYGITLKDYEILYKRQKGKCAICKSNQNNKLKKKFDIDHCHKTQKVRGLLCQLCNSGLGKFKDNTNFLKKAINYLRKNV